MNEETKKLFDAPWGFKRIKFTSEMTLNRITYKHGETMIPHVNDTKNGKRIVYLPKLYDALCEAAGGKCWSCAGVNVDTVLDNGCPKEADNDCYVAKWIELLKKVRDGEK